MTPFIITIQIVAGILTPALIVLIVNLIRDVLTNSIKAHEQKIEELKKRPPYDDIKISQPPNPTMFTIKFIKEGEVAWEESYDKDKLEVL